MRGQDLALFFPGQGTLDRTAIRRYRAECPDLAPMLAEAYHFVGRLRQPPTTWALSRSAHAGVALDLLISVTSVAACTRLLRQGVRPRALVGHGFGEIAALVAAEALSLQEGACMVACRHTALASGRLGYAMAALQGSAAKIAAFLRMLGEPAVSIAAENSSTQSVIVGPVAAISAAGALAQTLGLPFRSLKSTSGAHQRAMSGTRDAFMASLSHITPRTPKIPVFSPILGRRFREGDDIVACLADQLVRPLRFAEAVASLMAKGVALFIECGPLRGLAAQLDCLAAPDIADLSGYWARMPEEKHSSRGLSPSGRASMVWDAGASSRGGFAYQL